MRGLFLNALQKQEPIEIIYLSDKGQLSQRIIVIEHIEEKYIKAFCKLRKQPRVFKISNILSAGLARKKRKWAI